MGDPKTQDERLDETKDAKKLDQTIESEPERLGDVLGLSDASPDVEIPQASQDHGGNPAGIEVRTPTTGTSELKQGKGATGIQIGAGESGTDIEPDRIRHSAVDADR